MQLSEVRRGDRFYERQLIFCYPRVAISDPYRIAHMLVVDTTDGPISENTLGLMRGDRFSREPLPARLICKQLQEIS